MLSPFWRALTEALLFAQARWLEFVSEEHFSLIFMGDKGNAKLPTAAFTVMKLHVESADASHTVMKILSVERSRKRVANLPTLGALTALNSGVRQKGGFHKRDPQRISSRNE